MNSNYGREIAGRLEDFFLRAVAETRCQELYHNINECYRLALCETILYGLIDYPDLSTDEGDSMFIGHFIHTVIEEMIYAGIPVDFNDGRSQPFMFGVPFSKIIEEATQHFSGGGYDPRGGVRRFNKSRRSKKNKKTMKIKKSRKNRRNK